MSPSKVLDPELVRFYEISYLISPALAEDKVAGALAPLKDLLAGKDATVLAEDTPKFRRLAYPIKKFDSASFGWIRFEADAGVIAEVKKVLTGTPDIIRFLIVKAEKVAPASAYHRVRDAHAAAPASPHKGAPATPVSAVSVEELDRKIDALVGA